MKRKVTSEERMILLDNPELVMFNPYKGFKVHSVSLGKALIPPVIVGVLMFLWGFLCPDYINAHPTLFASVSFTAIIFASGFIPILYIILDDRAYNKARKTHYAKYLKMLMPHELNTDIAHIKYVVYEKAEGGWILDGKEEFFGYCGFVNFFRMEPETDVAVVYGDDFFAYIKKDPGTESFYNERT
ncbi:MAG: hypothetical protein J5476_15095 [Lachnospiraceae bacterium]|nr:hypothetical protein [Lachnospiraceae bacterium]